jgi:hypothetical protein
MVNRLYKPKSAVGTVLMAEYKTVLWGDSEEEAEWNVILEGAFDKTSQQVVDLARWNAPGAKALQTAFAGITTEATSTVTDYHNLVDNFKKVQGAAQAAHDDWKTHGSLLDFVTKRWKAVSGRYRFVRNLDRRWVDKGLYAAFLKAESDFLVAFSQPGYENAGKALDALEAEMQRVVDAVRDRTEKQQTLVKEYEVESKRKENFEAQVEDILKDARAVAFTSDGELNAQVRVMRLAHIPAESALKSVPDDALMCVANWRTQLDLLETGLKAFHTQHPKPDEPELPVGDTDFSMFVQVLPVPFEVVEKYEAVLDAVLPKEHGGELVALRQSAKTAYTAVNDAPAEDREGLIDKFDAIHNDFMQTLAGIDAANGPAARLAAERVSELADAGLLPIMSVQDRLKLLRKLRGSCQPLARTERPFKLSGLGEAQAKLLASFSMDEEFRKVDRSRRKQIAKALVANTADKRDYKSAQSDWTRMSDDARLKICERIVATQCAVLKIMPCPIELEKREASNVGALNQESRTIFINNHPQAAFHLSFEEVSNTLFHETSHLWQLLMVEAFNAGHFKEGDVEYQQIRLFAENHKDKHPSAYVTSDQDGASYRKQPMEAHAYEVGDETQRLFLKALMH